MKKFAVLLVCLFLAAMAGCSEKDARPEELGARLMRIWQEGNIEDLGAIMSADAEYEAAQQNHVYRGLEQVGRYVGHVTKFARDLKIDIISTSASKSTAALEWIMTGVQDRPIAGRVTIATNRPFRIQGVTLVEVKNGRIRKATDYMDVLGFILQLGGRVELPGGVVLPQE